MYHDSAAAYEIRCKPTFDQILANLVALADTIGDESGGDQGSAAMSDRENAPDVVRAAAAPA